jgi:hypothetical protein
MSYNDTVPIALGLLGTFLLVVGGFEQVEAETSCAVPPCISSSPHKCDTVPIDGMIREQCSLVNPHNPLKNALLLQVVCLTYVFASINCV